MKDRILNNWTFKRVLYIGIGIAISIHFVMIQQWGGLLFGAYFAAMGLFGFGCAGGNCYGGACETDIEQNSNVQETEFEEVK